MNQQIAIGASHYLISSSDHWSLITRQWPTLHSTALPDLADNDAPVGPLIRIAWISHISITTNNRASHRHPCLRLVIRGQGWAMAWAPAPP